jgi:hypothetical protein
MVHRQITLACHPLYYVPVAVFIKIKMILAYIKKTVRPQPERLVYLEVKA